MRYKTEEKLVIQVYSDNDWQDILGCSFKVGEDQQAWKTYDDMLKNYQGRLIRIGHAQFKVLATSTDQEAA